MSDLPEVVTLRRARMLWDAQRANPPLSIGKRPFRCIGGPLHGATARLSAGQSEYHAVVPKTVHAYFVGDDFPDGHPDVERGIYRIEKFGSGTHKLAVSMLVWQGVDADSEEALRLVLDAFAPEMMMAYEAREDA